MVAAFWRAIPPDPADSAGQMRLATIPPPPLAGLPICVPSLGLCRLLHSAPDLFRVQRRIFDPHANRIIDGIGNRGACAIERDFGDSFGSKWAAFLVSLD